MNAIKLSKAAHNLESIEHSHIVEACKAADQGDLSILKEMYNYGFFGADALIHGQFRFYGWLFDVKPYCRIFLIREAKKNHFRKVYAPDIMSLYRLLGGRHKIKEIYEIQGKELLRKD